LYTRKGTDEYQERTIGGIIRRIGTELGRQTGTSKGISISSRNMNIWKDQDGIRTPARNHPAAGTRNKEQGTF
jgi:hypothetical protein